MPKCFGIPWRKLLKGLNCGRNPVSPSQSAKVELQVSNQKLKPDEKEMPRLI